MNANVRATLNNISPFTPEELLLVEPFLIPVDLDKNENLLNEGQLCNFIFLVESGCLRSYYNNNGADVNLNFTFGNQFVTSFEAYVNKEPSRIIIQAMEKSTIWKINSRAFTKEHGSLNTFSTFIRRLIIRILLVTEEHHNMMRMNTPAERYQYILGKKPELAQRIPLGHLASYIGITRETLSRIRANKY